MARFHVSYIAYVMPMTAMETLSTVGLFISCVFINPILSIKHNLSYSTPFIFIPGYQFQFGPCFLHSVVLVLSFSKILPSVLIFPAFI